MKTRRFCPHCGRPVVKSQLQKSINRYTFQCYGCGEDFFKIEVYRKKDMKIVKMIRAMAYERELEYGTKSIHSFKKPYPKRDY